MAHCGLPHVAPCTDRLIVTLFLAVTGVFFVVSMQYAVASSTKLATPTREGLHGLTSAAVRNLHVLHNAGRRFVKSAQEREEYYVGDQSECTDSGVHSGERMDSPHMHRAFFHSVCTDVLAVGSTEVESHSYIFRTCTELLRADASDEDDARSALEGASRREMVLPTLSKTRRIGDLCAVLIPANSARRAGINFTIAVPWEEKTSGLAWRGTVEGSAVADFEWGEYVGALSNQRRVAPFSREVEGNGDRLRRIMSRAEQLEYKYVLSLTGADATSNLEWMMAQNSVVVMPTPKKESWLMEGLLLPWVHYAPLDDPARADELVEWLDAHEHECLQMVQHANDRLQDLLQNRDGVVEGVLHHVLAHHAALVKSAESMAMARFAGPWLRAANMELRCMIGDIIMCSDTMWEAPNIAAMSAYIAESDIAREAYYRGNQTGCLSPDRNLAQFLGYHRGLGEIMDETIEFNCNGKPKPGIVVHYLENVLEYCTMLRDGDDGVGTVEGGDPRFWVQLGDSIPVLSVPTVTKTRSIADKCGVLMPLNYRRHWGTDAHITFTLAVPWKMKKSGLVWRGTTTGYEDSGYVRREYVQALSDRYDVKFTRVVQGNDDWITNATMGVPRSRAEQLEYKYVLSLPGNDVASNLKWLMAQNSVVVMPTPKKEGWLMEGLLLPWVHYAPLDDPAKADELVEWLDAHERECLQMVQHANDRLRAVLRNWDATTAGVIRYAASASRARAIVGPTDSDEARAAYLRGRRAGGHVEYTSDSLCREPSVHRDTWCLGHVRHVVPTAPRRALPTLGIVLIAYDRPQYLHRVATSLSSQTNGGADVFVYVDFGEKQDAVVRICQELLPRAKITAPKTNHGIARLTLQGQKDIFAAGAFDRMLLIEEDHLIGPNYLEVINALLDASEAEPEVGMVNGNFKEVPLRSIAHEQGCSYQFAKYNSPFNTHNVWAWAVSREKWNRYIQHYERMFVEAKLHVTVYSERDVPAMQALIERECPSTGYSTWAGQDWLRACAFHASGMPYKFQPTKRYMTYIGKTGMHRTPASYKKAGFPTEPVSRRAVAPITPENVCFLDSHGE